MKNTRSALDFLDKPAIGEAAMCVVFGDERFLKREALEALRTLIAVDDQGEFSITTLDGEVAVLSDVLDAVATRSLFGSGRRMVLVESADDFVKNHRAALEVLLQRPSSGGVLVLDVTTWPKTTRLYKALDNGTGVQIDCGTPKPAELAKWLPRRAADKHGAVLDRAAAQMLVETLDPDVGVLDQELARLALLVSGDQPITCKLVETHVGGWKTRTAWEMIDAILDGNAAEAFRQLDRLLVAGDNPIALLAQIASSLRRMATAAQYVQLCEQSGRRTSLPAALDRAGVKKFVMQKSERHLKQVGRQRAARINRWLLEADLALKGSSSAPARARLVLETLITRLSAKARPA